MSITSYASWQRPGRVEVSSSPEGLPLFDLRGAFGSARFSPQGAHLIAFTPAGGKPLLFLSAKSHLAPGKAIRGGVPVIFPWFGPREGHPESPMHGLVRTRLWTVEALEVPDSGPAVVRLSLPSDEQTLAQWAHAFELRIEFRLGATLEILWEVRNTGPGAFRFEQALHPYFPVRDTTQARVIGLKGAHYFDKTDQMRLKEEAAEAVVFTGETDRLYVDTDAPLALEDPVGRTRLVLAKSGSESSVVWNPWVAKAAALADLDDEEWRVFVCVEQVNAARNARELAPGESHSMHVEMRMEDLG